MKNAEEILKLLQQYYEIHFAEQPAKESGTMYIFSKQDDPDNYYKQMRNSCFAYFDLSKLSDQSDLHELMEYFNPDHPALPEHKIHSPKEALKALGWEETFTDKEWAHDLTDRYVDIDGEYIDVYGYNYDTDEKYKGWLTKEEFQLFNSILMEIPEEED